MYELYKLNKVTTGTTFVMVAKAATVSSALALAPRAGSGRYQVWDGNGHKCAAVKIDLPADAVVEPVYRTVAVNRIGDLLAG